MRKEKILKTENTIQIPNAAERRVLLHSCCAPCSSAILEWMLQNGLEPTVFYSNSNIFPREEYLHRRDEIERHLQSLGVAFVEDRYDHQEWLDYIKGLEQEPERGSRCQQCFRFRLERAARYGREHGFRLLTTTLASSRWKNLEQINKAGEWAVSNTVKENGTADVALTFWPQNWRKGGLQERRNQLLREFGFYNQLYCGCEFSMRPTEKSLQAPESLL